MNHISNTCSDCGGVTEWIKLVDSTDVSGAFLDDKGSGSQHLQLQYAAEEAERSAWLKRYPIKGHIRGKMCTSCGRVTLYGIPKDVE